MIRKFTFSSACLALSLTCLLSFYGCSSYLDPDIAYKGKVDEAFLNSLSRGEISTTFKLSEVFYYEMDYELYGTSHQKWIDTTNDDIMGRYSDNILPNTITITQGNSWQGLNLYHLSCGFVFEHMILDCWVKYKEDSNFHKSIYIPCPFEFNATERTLRLQGREFIVEKAENNELIISILGDEIGYKDGKRQPILKSKTVIILKKNNFEEIDTENSLFFDSRREAYLGMVKILQEYYGESMEIINPHAYEKEYITIDFLELEEEIIEVYNEIEQKMKEQLIK